MPITERVREILSWYGSDSPGTLTNLARMLSAGALGGTGRMVILPVDQGFEHGPARSFAPNPAGYDPRYHFQLAIDLLPNSPFRPAPYGLRQLWTTTGQNQISLRRRKYRIGRTERPDQPQQRAIAHTVDRLEHQPRAKRGRIHDRLR